MDKTLEQLVNYVARSLKQGVPEDTIRKALLHNDGNKALFEQALVLAKEKNSPAVPAHDHPRKTASTHLSLPKSSGAESLAHNQTISLHDPSPTLDAKAQELQEAKAVANELSGQAFNWDQAPLSTAGQQTTQETAQDQPQQQPWTPPAQAYQVQPQVQLPQRDWPPQATNGYPMPADPAAMQPYGYPAYPPAVGSGGDSDPNLSPEPIPLDSSGYGFSQALADSLKAARYNSLTYVETAVVGYATAGAVIVMALTLVRHYFALPYVYLLTAPSELLKATLGSTAIYITAYCLAATVIITLTSLALHEAGKAHKRPIGPLLERSFKVLLCTAGAVVLSALIAFVPAAALVIIPVTLLMTMHASAILVHLIPLLYLAGLIWWLAIGLNYALAPYVALYEKGLTPLRTLSRSKQLLSGIDGKNGGRWFVIKTGLVMAIVLIGVSLASGASLKVITTTISPVVLIAGAVLSPAFNAALLMLYLNRRRNEDAVT